MKRAIPVLVLSVAGLIPVWRYEPSLGTPTTEAASPASTPSAESGSAETGSSESGSSESGSSESGSAADTVVKGSTVNTDKGPVQVQVTFAGDRITAVKMLQQPNHPQTTAAVPQLVAETLEAQSADVDTVSGATITSEGYKESLQAAIDAKGA
ncbi:MULTISPECIES: FMN-binding protein [Streptomyces]|uniref:FMN-binding protein n=1 Tax=Streptomyces TaxID=1883 RepID=UPI0004C6FF11|nr:MULTISPECIES: FMN-binding protein [unclassified Streptomyces]SEC02165.1 FMN-binding domain-containing protein [Streptomyces sp. KS_5]SED36561.1 FMN-binding domain-containing protein [Streptomyces sp. PAN_FS17]